VIKPAQDTPLSAEAIIALAYEVGIPEGVLQLVTCSLGNVAEVGTELVTNPHIRKVSFTGSTGVGKMLEAQAASTMKRTSMELGGASELLSFVLFLHARPVFSFAQRQHLSIPASARCAAQHSLAMFHRSIHSHTLSPVCSAPNPRPCI
jgi:hypothetical protein